MMWVGCAFVVISGLFFALKTLVIWDVLRHPESDGGVPTADYFFFYPVFMAFGVWLICESLDVVPLPFFGVLVWFGLFSLAHCIHWFLYRVGERP